MTFKTRKNSEYMLQCALVNGVRMNVSLTCCKMSTYSKLDLVSKEKNTFWHLLCVYECVREGCCVFLVPGEDTMRSSCPCSISSPLPLAEPASNQLVPPCNCWQNQPKAWTRYKSRTQKNKQKHTQKIKYFSLLVYFSKLVCTSLLSTLELRFTYNTGLYLYVTYSYITFPISFHLFISSS